MNQSKKILAALVAIPASIIVAGEVQAAKETTSLETIEIKNDFVGNTTFTNKQGTKNITVQSEADLKNQILYEMANYKEWFAITYTGTDIGTYKTSIEAVINNLKSTLTNKPTVTTASGETVSYDVTELYGAFNNVRVKATETKVDNVLSSVKLEFSFNYYGDTPSLLALNATATELTTVSNTRSIIKTGMNDIQKIKAIHDFIIKNSYIAPNNQNVTGLVLNKAGSAHTYALWTYKLLKAAGVEARYVSGIYEGELYSWNLVKVGTTWYHLDVAGDDSIAPDSKDIKYKYFLANNKDIAGRQIYYGNEQITSWGTDYEDFKNIVNPAESDSVLYFADAENNGEIYKLNLTGFGSISKQQIITGATSGFGKILYYKQTSADSTTVVAENLYFINDSAGKFLYKYDLNPTAQDPLKVLINEPVKAIELNGSRLTYTLSGTKKTIQLNQLDSYNNQQAVVVINAIAALSTTSSSTEVVRVRKLFSALTPDQKKLVTNITDLDYLEKTLAGNDAYVKNVIERINNLDVLDTNYVADVDAVLKEFKDLSDDQRLKVYNKSILDIASGNVSNARSLNTEISSILTSENEPFKTIPTFIQKLSAVIEKYDDLLPSLKEAIEPAQKTFMVTYRSKAIELREGLQGFVNTVNILNANSLDYLTSMVNVKKAYEEELLVSQLYLLTSVQKQKVEQNISKAYTMNQEIATFNTYMATVSSGDAATIQLTQRLINAMKAADVLYKNMLPAQKAAVDYTKLQILIMRIQALETGSSAKVEEVRTAINNLNYKTLTITQLVAAVEAVVTKYSNLSSEEIALLPEATVNIYKEYEEAILNIESIVSTIQSSITGLTENSSKTDVEAIRAAYDALTTIQKFYVNITTLVAQEERIQLAENIELARPIIVEIEALTETSTFDVIKTVYDKYIGLSPEARVQVTNKNKLLELWDKVNLSKEAINRVIAMIEVLDEDSTNADIIAVKEAYDALPDESKPAVTNYSKLEDLVARVEANKSLEQLINKIKGLSDDATPLEIQALREEYDALTDELKALIPANVLKILESFEKQMQSQLEAATKEAQPVIDRINKIDLNKYTEAQITSIYNAYGALSLLAKDVVIKLGAYEKLMNALDHVKYQNTIVKQAKLEAAAFDEHMNKLDRNSSTAEIAAARALYNRLSYEAKRNVQTYDKLVRLETMWKDPTYIELVHTYYPDYIHAIKPGGIEITKPNYDSLYIPDDLESDSVANYLPAEATWSSYEEMTYRSGRYMANITSSQVKNLSDRTLTLKADDMEIILPVVDLKDISGTVGVSVSISNNRLNIAFTENGNDKTFSEYVEVRVPISAFKGQRYQMIERIVSNSGTAASFKVDGADFVIRTKTSGTFQGATSNVNYNDLGTSSAGNAVREFAKRGITYNTTGRSVQMTKQATRADVATLIAKALDLSSSAKTKYQDLSSAISASRAQALQEAGIMSGVTSSRFGINTTVTKQEAAIIIANMYRYLDQNLSQAYNALKTNYTDVSNLTFEARQSIAILELFGVVDGNGKFDPNEHLTRGQFAELLYKSLTAIDFL